MHSHWKSHYKLNIQRFNDEAWCLCVSKSTCVSNVSGCFVPLLGNKELKPHVWHMKCKVIFLTYTLSLYIYLGQHSQYGINPFGNNNSDKIFPSSDKWLMFTALLCKCFYEQDDAIINDYIVFSAEIKSTRPWLSPVGLFLNVFSEAVMEKTSATEPAATRWVWPVSVSPPGFRTQCK